MEFELKALLGVIGREISRVDFRALPSGTTGTAGSRIAPARRVVDIGCSEEVHRSDAPFGIRNRTGAHEWGCLAPLIRSRNGAADVDEPDLLGIAILTHAPCVYVGRWLSGTRPDGFEDLDDLLRFDGLDRKALLREPDRVPPEHRDLAAAMVLARCQARSAALEAAALPVPGSVGRLVSFGVGLPGERVLFGGAYWFGPKRPGGPAQFLGVGDDPSRYLFESRGGELWLLEEVARVVSLARNHRARIRSLLDHLDRFDQFDPAADDRAGAADTAAGLKIGLRVHAQAAPVQTVMRLLGAGFLEIRQMIWFSSTELTASKVRRARELLRCFERTIDGLDAHNLQRLVETLHLRGDHQGDRKSRRRSS